MTISAIKRPVRRRTTATDGSSKQRPLFVEIAADGTMTIWPRRCKPEFISLRTVYQHAIALRVDRERREKNRGKPVRVKRGML